MIGLIAGELGSGKSLFALDLMESTRLAAPTRPILTNIELRPTCWYHDSVTLIGTDEFPIALEDDEPTPKSGYRYFWEYAPNDALIVLDEIDIHFDSTDFGRMKKNCKIYFKQLRKFGHDVYGICQRLPSVYCRIRDLASRIVICEYTRRSMVTLANFASWFGEDFALLFSRFIRSEFSHWTCTPDSHRSDGVISFAEAQRMFNWYDTKQLLGSTETILRRFRPRTEEDDNDFSGINGESGQRNRQTTGGPTRNPRYGGNVPAAAAERAMVEAGRLLPLDSVDLESIFLNAEATAASTERPAVSAKTLESALDGTITIYPTDRDTTATSRPMARANLGDTNASRLEIQGAHL